MYRRSGAAPQPIFFYRDGMMITKPGFFVLLLDSKQSHRYNRSSQIAISRIV